jgi:hypothetical protein
MKGIILFTFSLLITQLIYAQTERELEANRYLRIINNKYGITDSSGKIIIPFIYDYIDYKNTRLIVRKNNMEGLLTMKNEKLIPIKYQFLLPRINMFILWGKKVKGVCDINGKIILPAKYKTVGSTGNDDFYITQNENNLYGVYDSNGKNILQEAYKFFTIDNYKIFALKSGNPLIIDLQNLNAPVYLDTNIQFVYTARHLSMGEKLFQIVKKQNKYGLINSGNETIIPIIYDDLRSADQWKYFLFKKNNKTGLIHVDGRIIKEAIYDKIDLRKEHVLLKRKGFKDEVYFYE